MAVKSRTGVRPRGPPTNRSPTRPTASHAASFTALRADGRVQPRRSACMRRGRPEHRGDRRCSAAGTARRRECRLTPNGTPSAGRSGAHPPLDPSSGATSRTHRRPGHRAWGSARRVGTRRSTATAPLEVTLRMPIPLDRMAAVSPAYTANRAVNAVPYVCAAAPGHPLHAGPSPGRPGAGMRSPILLSGEYKLPEMSLLLTPARRRCQSCETNSSHMSYDDPGPARGDTVTISAESPAVQAVYFDPYDVDINADPYPTFRRLREEAPLYYNEQHDFYALSRFADVEQGAGRPRDVQLGARRDRRTDQGQHRDPAGHSDLRGSADPRHPPQAAGPDVHAAQDQRAGAEDPRVLRAEPRPAGRRRTGSTSSPTSARRCR